MRMQQAAAVQQLSQQAHMLAMQAQALGGDRTPDGALLQQQALAAKAQVQQMEQHKYSLVVVQEIILMHGVVIAKMRTC